MFATTTSSTSASSTTGTRIGMTGIEGRSGKSIRCTAVAVAAGGTRMNVTTNGHTLHCWEGSGTAGANGTSVASGWGGDGWLTALLGFVIGGIVNRFDIVGMS